MKILVADDSKLVLSLISSLIKSLDEHYQVLTANNGAEAITVAENEKPDLILMDWQMPTMSGLDALKKIKESTVTQHIPVVMLTASENTAEAFRFGATDFIQKPFQKEEFITRIKNILAAIKGPAESNEEKLKTEWLNLEAEKDRLRNLKETLIRQKKELTQILGKTKVLHHKFYLEPPLLKENFSEYFVVSCPLLDIPSHMVCAKKRGNQQILIAVGIFHNKGISAFLSAFLCEKVMESLLPDKEKDLSILYQIVTTNMKEELETEPLFKFIQIDPSNNNITWYGANIPTFLFSGNKLINLDNQTMSGSFHTNDTLYVIQNGFLENIDSKNSHDIFVDFISQHQNSAFEQQKSTLEENIKIWQKELRQQNDILVLGIRL